MKISNADGHNSKNFKKYEITEKFKLAHKVRGNGCPGSRLTLKPQKL